jgi:HD-like signal output (HDOD) protein
MGQYNARGDDLSPKRLLVVSENARRQPWLDQVFDERQWQVEYATNAADVHRAVASKAGVHCVAAERGTPGLERPSLLEELRVKHPELALASLVGQGSPRQGEHASYPMIRSTEPTAIQTLLDRAVALQRVIGRPAVRSLVSGIAQLSSVPDSYWTLMNAASQPDITPIELAQIVESDPALHLRVLQLINSAFFGLSARISTMQQAMACVGSDLFKGFVLTAHVFSALDTHELRGFSLDRFQLYSFRVARFAQRLAANKQTSDAAFRAALMRDIGELFLAAKHPGRFQEMLQRVAQTGEPYRQVELEVFGAGHEHVGAYLLSTWGLPFEIVECVARHHDPGAHTADESAVIATVHAVVALTGIITCGEAESTLDAAFVERAGLSGLLPNWRASIEAASNNW